MKQNKFLIHRIIIFTLVVCGTIIGSWLWWNDGVAAVETGNTDPVTFSIDKGEDIKSVVTRLAQNRIIRSPTAFYVLIKISGLERQIQAGNFRLSRDMDGKTIAQTLTHGVNDIWITLIEGWRNEEIAAVLLKELDIPESQFMSQGRIGYMFPDTYLIPQEATAGAVVQIFSDTFEKNVTQALKEKIASSEMSLDEIVIMASIVEREGKSDQDRPIIAGILFNRMKDNYPLEVDATVQYALGYQPEEKTWWKKSLYQQDKEIDSPYNTYKYAGLPPSAICNPGLESIRAVVYPQVTDYYYYLHDATGELHYARTFEEHEQNISRYLR